MSTETEIAGNYALSGGEGDPSYVAEKLASIKADREETAAEAANAAELRESIESEEVDYGTIDVDGESVPIEQPLGAGRRFRIAKEAREADERGDEMAQIDAVLKMIDALVDATPAAYDRDFWDDRMDATLRDAYQQLGRQSAGGAQAGN